MYAYEPGVRIRAGRFSGTFTAFDLEYLDTPQRRAIVFPGGLVGTSIFGFQVVRQDAAGLAYIAQDIRPIGTSVNVDRARVLGFEANGDVRVARQWTATAYYAMSNGRLQSTGEYMRRMSPPIGGARLRWSAGRRWVEGGVTFAQAQTRFNSGDLTDARIGATRTRTSIANYFSGTATDLGLVKGGILVATGETVAQVQTRLLGSATSGLLFSEAPGFVALGARAGVPLASHVDLIVIGENLTDRNYRLYGSGVDSPGTNLEIKARYRF
jgi:outer membrane receptor protein involved in Fe transport